MNKTKLFNNAIKAIDNYNKAVEMDFPQSYIDLLDKRIDNALEEIKKHGFYDEFAELAGII